MFSDIVLIFLMILFVVMYHPEEQLSVRSSGGGEGAFKEVSKEGVLLINVGVFILLNVSYLLTQFLNPGIINLWGISE